MRRIRRQPWWLAALPALLVAGACAGTTATTTTGIGAAEPAAVTGPDTLSVRVGQLQDAVSAWSTADQLPAAKAAAETAANLVTGSGVTEYGDRDSDGVVSGANAGGLLPGEHGEPGLASGVGSTCLDADVLGGSWDQPARRWAELSAAIAAWSAQNNTFPALRSHPQRIVGWATLAIGAPELASAHEYAGHAQTHIEVTTRALASCTAIHATS